ncbi:MAG: sulfurtransferase [Cetobacterium sp.]
MKKKLMLAMLLLSVTLLGKDYSEYKTGKLISAETAKKMIQSDENVIVIDVRQNAKFVLGNVEGSYNMWRPDMEPKDGRYGDIGGMRASREEMETELNKMGVTNDSTLILIGEGLDEYRLWWILDMYGMENIKLVDGGYSALKNTGLKVRYGKEAVEKQGDFKFQNTADKETLALIDDVKEAIGDSNKYILDTRSRKEFTGEELKKGAVVKGRIPGSVWVEWTEALDNDKTMKSYDELVSIYEKQGLDSSKEVLAYCQSAVRSAHTTFVLKELLGYSLAKNYDGSWIEWSYAAKDGKVKVEVGE